MTISPPAAAPLAMVGREFHRGHAVPIRVVDARAFEPASARDPRFVIAVLPVGACELAGQRVAAPALLLLDEATRPALRLQPGGKLQAIYFHPLVVNGAFRPDKLRATASFPGTMEQDAYLLRPFVEAAQQILPLPPELLPRLLQLVELVAAEGEAQRDPNWPCRTRSYLFELLFVLRLLGDRDLPPPPLSEPLDRVLGLIRQDLAAPLTLAELARQCGTNRTTLAAYLRRRTGKSFRDYVIGLRMETAAALLRDTHLPIAEIMRRVGYEDQSSFTRAFRDILGATPARYRREQSWMLRMGIRPPPRPRAPG